MAESPINAKAQEGLCAPHRLRHCGPPWVSAPTGPSSGTGEIRHLGNGGLFATGWGQGIHMGEGGWHHRQSSALAKVKLTGPGCLCCALGPPPVPIHHWEHHGIAHTCAQGRRGGQDRQPCTRQACCPRCTLMAGGGSGLTCPLAGDDGHWPQENCTDPGGSKPVLQPQCIPREGTTGG